MTSPNANRPNILLLLKDHIHSEISDAEKELLLIERKATELRDYIHTLRDVRAAAKLETPTPEEPA